MRVLVGPLSASGLSILSPREAALRKASLIHVRERAVNSSYPFTLVTDGAVAMKSMEFSNGDTDSSIRSGQPAHRNP
jgi:hypothetical protein